MTDHFFMGIDPNKTVVIVLNENGLKLAHILKNAFGCSIFAPVKFSYAHPLIVYENIYDAFVFAFSNYRYIVAIMAEGIVVRKIANLITSKHIDPAVVVVDEMGHYAVSVLSGHEGGANRLACLVASILGGEPVISTASEVLKKYIIGLGFRKNVTSAQLSAAASQMCKIINITFDDIKFIATIKSKMHSKALEEFIVANNFLFRFIDEKLIRMAHYNFVSYKAPEKYLNIPAACEPSAILSAKRPELICPRQIINGVAIAVVREALL